jgi:hypothetical protein
MERKEAQLAGVTRFTTGRPCINGHLTYRYTSTGSCSQCVNGVSKAKNPETLNDQANTLRMTALSTYNETIKTATATYERAMAAANDMVLRVEELKRELEVKTAEASSKLDEYKAEKERKEAVRKMIKLNVFIHPSDVVNAKDWILTKAREVCKDITMNDVSATNKFKSNVLYTIKCFEEHKDEILTATNKAYNEHNIVAVPRPQ